MYFRVLNVFLLNFEYFIARKNLKNEVEGKKVSRPIIKISIISISLAMLVNIITVAVVIGFQREVSDKVLGFGAHAFVASSSSASLYENEPILKNQQFTDDLKTLPFIKNIQRVAYKPAILQSRKNNINSQEIQSVLVKGVDNQYDFEFFRQHLVEGKIPDYSVQKSNSEILISKRVAQDLHYKIGDTASAFFVKNQPIKKQFTITGIFETGMEDFDKKMVLADISQIQQLNDWGIKAQIRILDTLIGDYLVVKGEVSGGNGNYRLDWGKGYGIHAGFTWYPEKDTVFKLIASDYWMFIDGHDEQTTLPDTAYLKVSVKSKSGINYPIKLNPDKSIYKKYLNDSGTKFRLFASDRIIDCELIDGKGSFNNYVGAFEFNFHNWDHFDENIAQLEQKINFRYSDKNQDLKVSSLKEHQREIFVWLAFLDINVWIIISLMLLIGIINMGSAMLVMILLRTPFIGLMKAMGTTNWSLRKIFLYQIQFLILRGMFWGNLIGIGLCVLQDQFKIIKLNPEVYYLNAVPIDLNFTSLLFINILTLIICLCAMLIPSWAISRISPVKAIKFN